MESQTHLQRKAPLKKAAEETVPPSQLKSGGASLRPPQFKLEASTSPIQQKVVESEKQAPSAEKEGNDPSAMLAQVAADYPGKDWQGIYGILEPEDLGHQLPEVCDDIFHSGEWNIDPKARSLGILDDFEYGVAGEKETQTGYVEVVEDNQEAGIRAMVPYGQAKGAHGGNLILNPHRTTTVLGRFIDVAAHDGDTQAAIDAESGTNYFRFQENFKVGENKAGGNVLSIADWSEEKNIQWLAAAVARGDVIRFVSDPMAIENIFYDGNLEKGLTVTGLELGILLNLGFAPDPETSLVTAIGELDTATFPEFWQFALEIGKGKGIPTQVSGETSNPRFYSERADTNLSPVEKENKETGAVSKQTNFFGNKNVKLEEK